MIMQISSINNAVVKYVNLMSCPLISIGTIEIFRIKNYQAF